MAKSNIFLKQFFKENSGIILDLMENELTSVQKCYIIMYYRDSKTVRQIANECGVSPSTVCRTMNRGMTRFYKSIGTAEKLYGVVGV